MARFSGALSLCATFLAVALAAQSAAAIDIPSILATSDGGPINFISLANTSNVVGVDILAGDNSFGASLLGSWADSRYAFTVGTVSPGTTYRVFVTDLSNTTVSGGRPVLLGSLVYPNGYYNPTTCPLPILGPLSGVRDPASGNYTLLLATQCSYRAPLACGTERVRDVIQVIRATYTPAAARFTLGTLAADLRAQLPVPACQRATLIGTQINNGVVQLLARTATTTVNLNRRIGDLAVFELRSNFRTVNGELVRTLSMVKTFRAIVNGLRIVSGVPGSRLSIIAAATDARGVTKLYNWASGKRTAVGGLATAEPARVYNDITSNVGNVYSTFEDFTTVPAGDPPTGRLQLTTAAQLAAGQPGTVIATDNVPYVEINYIGRA